MSNKKILIDELTTIQKEALSGRLVVYGRLPNNPDVLLNAQLYFNSGNLVRITLGTAKDADALPQLLALTPERVVFLKTAGESTSGTTPLPSIADLTARFAGGSAPTINTDELIADATQALASIFGKNAKAEVTKAAAKSPPETDPVAFLQTCQARAEVVFGKGMADNLFDPLYKKVRG
ncbi:MAG: hypothetical protein KDJ99_33260 [Candidatus Competibacteraceae bacterium]|nr:hypothetical protein [Candidatus Competibacteraceae bacterium]